MDDLGKVFEAVASYFSILSEPTRLRIMHSICPDEKSVGEIVEELNATQSNVSRHLALMLRGKVVSRRREGNQVFYRIADPTMMEICRSVCAKIAGQIREQQPLRRGLLKLVPDRRRRTA